MDYTVEVLKKCKEYGFKVSLPSSSDDVERSFPRAKIGSREADFGSFVRSLHPGLHGSSSGYRTSRPRCVVTKRLES